MPFTPFEVTVPHIAYTCLGGFIVLFGMFSLFLREKLYISEACWAFLFGVIVGPYCADIFNPRAWAGNEETVNVIVLEFTRVVLAIGVFAIGVELPKAYMARHWKSLFYLLVPVMTWGWVVSAGFIYALIPQLNFVSSLAVAACLTPTDPILAAAVIGGKWADKHVPAHLRHLLAAESGCNDGAAFPFLFLALYILLEINAKEVVKDWFLLLWFYQIFLGIAMGALLGFGFRHLMKFCERLDLIDRHSYVAQYVSLAMFTIGVTTLLGTDDLLAAFACGTAFAWDGFFNRQTEESVFSSVIDLLFNIAAFIFVGAWMPFSQFQDAELGLSVWRLIVIAILVLLFRRIPVMIALYRWIPDVKNLREALFSGHFGPMGIGAIFISTFALETIHKAHKTPENSTNYDQIHKVTELIHPIVGFMVLCSITAHGLSIPSFSLGRRVHSVSRTWSRHATATSGGLAQPEWMTHIRVADRGAADIVINRDSADVDLERGESEKTRAGSGSGDLSDKEREERGREVVHVEHGHGEEGLVLSPATPEVRFMDKGESKVKSKQKAEPSSAGETGEVAAPSGVSSPTLRAPEEVYSPKPRLAIGEIDFAKKATDYRDENYPDGGRMPERGEGDEITEWKQGRQRVIERRAGPGDDVEVTVIDDPDAPSRNSLSEAVHGLERTVSNELVAAAHGLQRVGSRVKDVVSSPSSRPSQSAMRMRRRRSNASQRSREIEPSRQGTRTVQIQDPSTSAQGSSTSRPVVVDEDESWESEDEDAGESKGHTAAGRKHHGKHRSTRVGHAIRSFVAGRRRGSTSHPEATPTEEPRGRARAPSRGADSEGRHSRIPSVLVTPADPSQADGSHFASQQTNRLMRERFPTRDSSPARSVRFAAGTSRAKTPQ